MMVPDRTVARTFFVAHGPNENSAMFRVGSRKVFV